MTKKFPIWKFALMVILSPKHLHTFMTFLFTLSVSAPDKLFNITTKIDDRINVLNENICQYNYHGTLSSPAVRTALDQIHENFVKVPIHKGTNNVARICKCFYVSVITKQLGLGNNDKTSFYNDTNDLSYNHTVSRNISDLSPKFGIENAFIENHQLPKMHTLPAPPSPPSPLIPDLLVSHKSSIKPFSQAITSVFRLFLHTNRVL